MTNETNARQRTATHASPVERKGIAGKHLIFELGDEQYGVPIIKVKEILGMTGITELPQLPEYVNGVINLRDKVIPVVDLRKKFRMEPVEHTNRTCIIVLEITDASARSCREAKNCTKTECPGYGNIDRRCWLFSKTHCRGEVQGSFQEKITSCRECDFYKEMHQGKTMSIAGIIVDAVSEVLSIKSENIEPPPSFGQGPVDTFLLGMAKENGNVRILLDIDRVMTAAEIDSLAQAV